ncbi:MAG: hypothetical protein ACOYYS_13510 [Chloroflexota bacterium]
MKSAYRPPLLLLLCLLLALTGKRLSVSAAPLAAPRAQNSAPGAPVGGPIVADHTVVAQYGEIPSTYIDAVKEMWVTIPGESHSAGYRRGSELLETQDTRFQVNVLESGTPEGYTNQYLRLSRATWGDLGNTTGWRYDYGEEDWFTSAIARQRTQDGIAYANTHNLTIAAMGFGWCWDMSYNSSNGTIDPVYQVRWGGASQGGPQGNLRWGLDAGDQALTGNSINMSTYIGAVEEYIAYTTANSYPTRVFFTTGPVDDERYNIGENGYQRHLKHQYIRDYVHSTADRILFDYADILTWSNAGNENLISWTDYGSTPRQYPYIHSDNLLDLQGNLTGSIGHIGERGALRLGKALWWMLARMAGWDGVTGTHTASVASGDWNAPATWGGAALDASDGVTVTAGTTVNVNANTRITALTVEQGATLVIPAGVTLDVTEHFINRGTVQITRPVNNGTVDFHVGDESRGIVRYRLASITSANNLGEVTVRVRALNDGESCASGTSTPYARRCFEITPTNNLPATLYLWAFEAEMNGISTPRIYRYADDAWTALTANTSTLTQGGYTYVAANTPGFSHFLIAGSEAPTAARVTNFRVQRARTLPVGLAGALLALIAAWAIRRIQPSP